jgi:signal transduction histidine kinase
MLILQNRDVGYRITLLRDVSLVAAFALALAAVAGNLLHIDVLRNFTPWGTFIKVNPALCLLFVTTSIGLLIHGKGALSQCTALIALSIAAVTAAEWLFSWDAGIDQLLVTETATKDQLYPGRMPLNAALAFCFLSASAWCSSSNKRCGQLLAAISFAIAMLSVVGLTYGLQALGMFGTKTLIALPMALALVSTSLAAFLVYPEEGYARLFTRESYGGFVARSVLPLSAIFPLVGVITGIGRNSDQDYILLAVFNAILLPIVVWLVATRIDRMDAEREKAFRAALLAKEEAVAANATKARFMATVSHEVRTPLSGVIGLNEILASASLEPEMKQLAEMALHSSKRLLHVVNDLLDFQKLEAGAVELEEREFRPADVVNEVTLVVKGDALHKQLDVNCQLDSALPECVVGDQLRLTQILLNFATNAVKFTEVGSITVSAKLVSQRENSAVIKFSVSDTGIGISTQNLNKLFQPFSQADNTISRRFGGTGLGLSICKNYAELMGGKIGVDTQMNVGSTFWCELPFRLVGV